MREIDAKLEKVQHDPLDDFQAENPLEWWAEMREAGPSAVVDGCPAFARRDDAMAVLQNSTDFAKGIAGGSLEMGNIRPLIPLFVDNPAHLRYRKLLDPLFAPRVVKTFEPRIRELVAGLIEPLIEQGSCDFAEAIAVPAPCLMFLEVLGLPPESLDELLAIKNAILRPEGETREARKAVQATAGSRLYALLTEELNQRKSMPDKGYLSRLLDMEVDGDKLSFDEILDICYLFVMAGLDTVTGMLSCSFAFLAANPDHRRRIADDPTIIPRAIEELLRHESVAYTVTRQCTQDVTVDGAEVSAGTPVVVLIGAANTDPSTYGDANDVNFEREGERHIAFGAGIHRCLGSHLARTELRIIYEEWHARIPEYWIPEGASLTKDKGPIRQVLTLPIRWK
jgi:cytochrome P450